MSKENVEIVKRALDAFNDRDVPSFEDLVTDDFEWLPAMISLVERGSFRGRDGVKTYFRESASTWSEHRVRGGEFHDLGDRIVVLGQMEGQGRVSGVAANSEIGMVFELRSGKLARARAYLAHNEAVKAAGLEE